MSLRDFKTIGDKLNTLEYNAIVSIFRHFITHNEEIHINNTVNGEYGTYNFNIEDTTILDSGILITDETISAQPTVKLTDNLFENSTYTLILYILHYTGANIFDDVTPSDFKVIDTVSVELEQNTDIMIPVENLQKGYIIDFDCSINIKHDKPIVRGNFVNKIDLSIPKTIIQTDEVSDITATAYDFRSILVPNRTIHFYEVYESTSINITGDKSIIQTDETVDVSAKLKDEDGSLIEGETIYFYEQYEEE